MTSQELKLKCRESRVIRVWLGLLCSLLLGMIVLGGATRLTRSGLAIVEWNPVIGILPPLSSSDWMEAFSKYQHSPEYQLVNKGMTLDEFKSIFYWEYAHRLVARLIGLAVFVPWVWFASRGHLSRSLSRKLGLGLALGGLQGALGWFMVKSGLLDRPSVSHYRLAMHLSLGIFILCYFFWLFLGQLSLGLNSSSPSEKSFSLSFKRLLKGFIALTGLQIVYGALTAGLHAGTLFTTFPKMNGEWIPYSIFERAVGFISIFELVPLVQWIHRLLGTVLLIACGCGFILYRKVLKAPVQQFFLRMLLGFVALQYALGVATLVHAVPVSLGVLHQLGACLVILSAVGLFFSLGGSGPFRREAAPKRAE